MLDVEEYLKVSILARRYSGAFVTPKTHGTFQFISEKKTLIKELSLSIKESFLPASKSEEKILLFIVNQKKIHGTYDVVFMSQTLHHTKMRACAYRLTYSICQDRQESAVSAYIPRCTAVFM